ncbi:thioredoxin domain containing protein [Nitzschia inconspicua]|uniref:Thioredoxin domain containing protein n=1 Tax=Nitzschia inconspicua TaxID=303405 RepID=A0A9K3KUR6_9STRA|nr:thioredoxin domain containing protein [Nitzschia inconspicua]
MGLSHSKSTALVLCVAIATSMNVVDIFVQGAQFPRSFLPPAQQQSVAFSVGIRTEMSHVLVLRGGEASTTSDDVASVAAAATTATTDGDEQSLDEKVFAAMKKLGLAPPTDAIEDGTASMTEASMECKDGVCTVPETSDAASTTTQPSAAMVDPTELSNRLSQEMDVDARLSMAALGATASIVDGERRYNEEAARKMIQQELDLISSIPEDSENVQTLVQEGFDPFFCRRALAFAEENLEDARAILIADQIDEEEEAEERKKSSSDSLDFVEVNANFDPTKLPTTTEATASPAAPSSSTGGMPKPALKESVVFEATTAQLQELVLESPVPVLLDIYADWCGPCKVLGPALEEMAIKSGGMFRLVKVNSDNERPVSQALEVTALPTVFGIRDGKIVHMFQGMPRSEDMMKNFMMGLFGAASFSPPVTAQETEKYRELTNKLIKAAGAASFSFSARERLTDKITTKLDDLVQDDSVPDVEGCAMLIRTFLSNIINNPYEQKYRKINLQNKVVAAKIGANDSCLAVLKSVGFAKSGTEMVLGKGKKVINIAPLAVARDCIDKWIQRNRNEMAAAARKRKDEQDRARILAEKENSLEEDEMEEEEDEDQPTEIDPNACSLRLRLDGKKQIHEAVLSKDDPLEKILEILNVDTDEEVQLTCVAKKLVVKSSETKALSMSLEEHGLMPSAAIVVKIGASLPAASKGAPGLKARAAEKKQKKGSHTMHSIGVYAKDDNNKAELIDGGGGVWYEHDITDDEAGDEENNGGKDEMKTDSGVSNSDFETTAANITEESASTNNNNMIALSRWLQSRSEKIISIRLLISELHLQAKGDAYTAAKGPVKAHRGEVFPVSCPDVLESPMDHADGKKRGQQGYRSSISSGPGRRKSLPQVQSSQQAASSSRAAKKRPWRKPKDMPKRPLSAYNLFFAEERKELLKNFERESSETFLSPDVFSDSQRSPSETKGEKLGFAGLARTVAAKWKSLDADTRTKYQNQAKIEKARYKEQMKAYNQEKLRAQEQAIMAISMEPIGSSAIWPASTQIIASLGNIYDSTSELSQQSGIKSMETSDSIPGLVKGSYPNFGIPQDTFQTFSEMESLQHTTGTSIFPALQYQRTNQSQKSDNISQVATSTEMAHWSDDTTFARRLSQQRDISRLAAELGQDQVDFLLRSLRQDEE